MYVAHPNVVTPPDSTKIWRYLDVAKYLALLDGHALYFSARHEFEDKWEGEIAASLARRLNNFTPEMRANLGAGYRMIANQARINCWHVNESESVAMWSLYTSGADGIAIQSTIGRLKDAVASDPRQMLIGLLEYQYEYAPTEEKEPPDERPFNTLEPLLVKRKSYEHEREVRLILPFPAETQFKEMTKNLSPKPGDTFVMPPVEIEPYVRVPLPTLIERIVISPKFPKWALSSLQKITSSAGLAVVIELSDLLKLPS